MVQRRLEAIPQLHPPPSHPAIPPKKKNKLLFCYKKMSVYIKIEQIKQQPLHNTPFFNIDLDITQSCVFFPDVFMQFNKEII